MLKNRKLVIMMPAFNAEKTITLTHAEVLDLGIVDHVIVVDDRSSDKPFEIASRLPVTRVTRHETDCGHGADLKTCYRAVLAKGLTQRKRDTDFVHRGHL